MMKASIYTITLFVTFITLHYGIEPPTKAMPIPPSNVEESAPDQQIANDTETTQGGESAAKKSSTPFAGVSLDEVPEELAMHLGLKPSSGALVRLVAPDSPAQLAGLQPFDIIETVDGKRIKGHECFCGILKKHQVGDEIEINLLRRGEKMSLKLVLGNRPEGLAAEPNIDDCDDLTEKLFRNIPERFAPEIRKLLDQNLRALGNSDSKSLWHSREQELEKLRQRAGQVLDEMKQMNPKLDDFEKNKRMLECFPDVSGEMSTYRHSRISLMDENGRIEVTRSGDSTEVRVLDRNGDLEWSGPYSSEQEKNAVPESVRNRLEKLNLQTDQIGDLQGKGFDLKLQLNR